MTIFRIVVCLLFPPLGVLDRGCGAILITSILTLAGWIPGQIAALVFASQPR